MKVPTEVLRRYLAEELREAGLTDERILDILNKVLPEKREPSRKRARLVLVEKLPQEVVEKYRKELELRAAERKLLRRERELTMRTIFVGGTRILGWVRQGEEGTLWDLRRTVKVRTPQTRRFLAQKLPKIRVRTVDVRMVIVTRPNQDEIVLTFPPRRQSGVALTPDMLRKSPDTVMIRVHHRDGMEECEVGVEDWREIVKSIPSFCRRCLQKVEVSVDGQRWFDAYEITKS
jgi:hypothetical protein